MRNLWGLLKKEINAEMETQGITKAELARRLDWQPQVISRYLGNDEASEPGLNKIAEIAAAINVPFAELSRRAAMGEEKKGPQQTSHVPATRDALLARFVELAVGLSLKELESGVSIIEKLIAKRKTKKDTSPKSQAG